MGSVRRFDRRGTLFLDFRYRGKRYREYTALPDTIANRKRLERVLTRIEQEIADGAFDYAAFFKKALAAKSETANESKSVTQPQSSQDATDAQVSQESRSSASDPIFLDFTAQWLRERSVEWRRSHLRSLHSTINRYLLPRFADKAVSQITKPDVFAFRSELAKTPGRKNKDALSVRADSKLSHRADRILSQGWKPIL